MSVHVCVLKAMGLRPLAWVSYAQRTPIITHHPIVTLSLVVISVIQSKNDGHAFQMCLSSVCVDCDTHLHDHILQVYYCCPAGANCHLSHLRIQCRRPSALNREWKTVPSTVPRVLSYYLRDIPCRSTMFLSLPQDWHTPQLFDR
jgi:hypothetical protein